MILQFGENVEGYTIPVLNEREVRAATGIMFLATFISLMLILFKGNFVPIKYVLIIFLTDFSIRLFVNPKFSPILVLGRLIVSNQNPEYVGAKQKKFAWYIGLVLSATMFVLMVIINSFSYITGIVCLICLILMFFETAFGICLGCKIYTIFNKEKAQYCPGEVCDLKAKQEIQKTSKIQLAVILIFIAFVLLTSILFNEKFKEKPHNLFETNKSEQIK
ncbi:MAG: DUF4395 domain-containing protein [Flavobacterium sp.]|uniref:DUF4395 domain-containing protein n=1 Tax=Flavobacterium sp. TaxID=239 RepID=UPI0026242523|nr:DUF4395 domain-containing protein [Flavobacterium sp.]MDD5151096.1 DUF4395 domain-containing protein [Flavobacterium sp.]